jgi:hypothetical protein
LISSQDYAEVNMKFAQIWIVIPVLLIAACNLAEEPEAPSVNETEIPPLKEVDPINVDVALDDSRAVSQLIPISGGTLTTTAADGTTFTLEIPDDALLYDTEITMTPIQVSEMPAGVDSGPGVQLDPDGLNLFNFATLTITPAREIPIDQQIFFGSEADGKNLSLALPEMESREMKINLLHFSDYFVGTGNLENVAAVLPRSGGAVTAELSNKVAELSTRERERQKREGDSQMAPEYINELAKLFQEYYDRYVKVFLDIAGESCAKGRLAINLYAHYTQLMRKVGLADRIVEIDYLAMVEKVGETCLREEYDLCINDHVIHRMIPFLLGLERNMQLVREALGLGEESASSSALLVLARQLTEQCLRFELEFESTSVGPAVGGDSGGSGEITVSVSASVPIRFNASTLELNGEGPLVHEEFSVDVEDCTVLTYPATGEFENGIFRVISLFWTIDDPKKEGSKVIDLRLEFKPDSRDIFTIAGNCNPSVRELGPDNGSHWDLVFLERHPEQQHVEIGHPITLIFKNWEILGEDEFATLEWQEAGTYSETGSFLLYHRPGQ